MKSNGKSVLITGISSDIGKAMADRFINRGYKVAGTYRNSEHRPILEDCELFHVDFEDKSSVSKFIESYGKLNMAWDMLISCPGTVLPLGKFLDVNFDKWVRNLHVNAIEHLRVLHGIYRYKRSGTSHVVFLAGTGTNSAPINYSAYTLSKIMLIKMCELIEAETDGLNLFVVGPGYTKTKAHQETLNAGPDKVGKAHYKKIKDFMKNGKGTSMDDIFECICSLSRLGKTASGRNFSVVNDEWKENTKLAAELESDINMYKLRRYRNEWKSHEHG